MSFKELGGAAKALYRVRFGEDASFRELEKLISGLDSINAERNRITHSAWGAGQGPDSITRIKTKINDKHGLQYDFEHYDEAKLKEFSKETLELAEQVQLFFVKLLEESELRK